MFRASHLKVERAKKHLLELRAEVEAYLGSEPLQLVWEYVTNLHLDHSPPNTELVGLVAHIRTPVPDTLSPIVGDIVHNLRSALDIMMCDIVLASDPSVPSRNIGFPCWSNRPRAKKDAIRRSNVARADGSILALVEAWEPFEGGASRIFELSELDNMDKHRAIIPTMTGAEYSEGHALVAHRLARADLIDPFPARRKVREGQVLMAGSKDIMLPAGTAAHAKCGLAFGEIANVIGRDLLEELSWQADIVTGMLFSFETGTFPKFVPQAPIQPVHVGNGGWLGPPGMSSEDVLKHIQEMAQGRSEAGPTKKLEEPTDGLLPQAARGKNVSLPTAV